MRPHTRASSLKYRLFIYGISILSGILLGRALLSQPVARQMAFDPTQYCEDGGKFDRNVDRSTRSVAQKLPLVTTIDYSSVCNINNLPVDALLSFPRITRVGVIHGNVTDIPEDVGKLTSLTRFQVQDQRLTSVPESIGNLVHLQILKLGGNDITRLPDAIGNLTALTTLHIYDNRLTALPETIGNLSSLTVLDARKNSLKSLPSTMTRLAGTLKKVYLGANQISPEEQSRIRTMLPQTEVYF